MRGRGFPEHLPEDLRIIVEEEQKAQEEALQEDRHFFWTTLDDRCFGELASKLRAMAFNPIAMASNLIAMAMA